MWFSGCLQEAGEAKPYSLVLPNMTHCYTVTQRGEFATVDGDIPQIKRGEKQANFTR